MPYYRKRKKSRDETWVFMAFGVLASVVGLLVVLSLVSAGLLGIGAFLTKLFPVLGLFQATMIPLVLLVSIGLYVTIALSAVDLKEAFSSSSADNLPADHSAAPVVPDGWRYGRQEASRIDL